MFWREIFHRIRISLSSRTRSFIRFTDNMMYDRVETSAKRKGCKSKQQQTVKNEDVSYHRFFARLCSGISIICRVECCVKVDGDLSWSAVPKLIEIEFGYTHYCISSFMQATRNNVLPLSAFCNKISRQTRVRKGEKSDRV